MLEGLGDAGKESLGWGKTRHKLRLHTAVLCTDSHWNRRPGLFLGTPLYKPQEDEKARLGQAADIAEAEPKGEYHKPIPMPHVVLPPHIPCLRSVTTRSLMGALCHPINSAVM